MLKIGDFSKFSRVTIKTLRYYDEIGLLKPVEVDPQTGYRYYSTDQLSQLNHIIGLKDLGLSLEEICHLMAANPSKETLITLIKTKRERALTHLKEEKHRIKRIDAWLRQVEKEGSMPNHDVVIKKIEIMTVASVRGILPNYGEISKLFKDLCPYLSKKRINFCGPPMALYFDTEYKEKNVDAAIAIPVTGNFPETEKIKLQKLPQVDQMACIIHQGPYEKLHDTYQVILTWIEDNGYQITGVNREIYLKGPDDVQKGITAEYITELQIPVKKL